jgi:hypothetical protein
MLQTNVLIWSAKVMIVPPMMVWLSIKGKCPIGVAMPREVSLEFPECPDLSPAPFGVSQTDMQSRKCRGDRARRRNDRDLDQALTPAVSF